MAPLLGTLALLLLPWIARGADAGAAPPYLPRKGLALTLWAREPEVADPVALNFDDQGRLYVAETARRGTVDIDIRSHPDWLVDDLSNRSIDDLRRFFRTRMSVAQSEANARWLPDHNRDGVHDWRDLMGIQERIRLLEDPGHSGHATRSTLFYEGFHEEVTGVLAGVFPWNGDVFATVYPDLWRLRDPRHTGTPVAVESVAHGFGVHAAFDGHDLHGLVMGPDGKIYFSQGDNGFVVRTREGATLRYPNTGGVFRMNPDGSELEVFAYGLRNVQEIAFDEFGNMFGVDNDGDLADERERFVYITEGSDSGWRLHWQFKDRGWRAQTRVPDYNPWIQERMWVPHHPGQPAHITPPISNYSVGPSGFRYNPGTGLNDSYRGSFFLVQFPVQKITSFKTRPRGAGFEMVGEHVLLSGMMASAVSFGPDGALYVADWDGMWNPDGKGAIWVLDDPTVSGSPLRREVRDLLHDGMRDKDSSRLQQLLAHPDMRIRLRSQFELVRRQEGSLLVKLARDTALPRLARIHALWGLGQLRLRNAAGRLPFTDPDPEIRAQSARVAGGLRARSESPALIRLLADPEPRVRFHAASALAHAGTPSAIPSLVTLLESNNDTDPFLRHAAVHGLAGIGKVPPLARLASHPSRAVRIGAVVALRRLGAREVTAFLGDADPAVRAEAVRALHDDDGIPEGLPHLAALLDGNLTPEPEGVIRRAISAAVRLGGEQEADRLIRFALDPREPESMRGEAFEALAAWDRTPAIDRVEGMVRRTVPLPPASSGLGRSRIQSHIRELLQTGGTVLSEAVARGASENALAVDPLLLQTLANAPDQPAVTRSLALRMLAAADPQGTLPAVEQAIDSPIPELRPLALDLLAAADAKRFTERVTTRFDLLGVPEQQRVLALAGRLKQPALDSLIRREAEALARGQAPRELALDILSAAAGRKITTPSRAAEPVSPPSGGIPPSPLLRAALYGGDPRRGEEIFRTHVTAQCVRCHDAGGEGKQVGPVLKGVGSRGTREYLLESLIDPSARIAPGYETTRVTLPDGDLVEGRRVEETDASLTLRLPDGEVRSIPKAGLQGITTSGVSSMPPMGEVLSPFEIRDLVAFLAAFQ